MDTAQDSTLSKLLEASIITSVNGLDFILISFSSQGSKTSNCLLVHINIFSYQVPICYLPR